MAGLYFRLESFSGSPFSPVLLSDASVPLLCLPHLPERNYQNPRSQREASSFRQHKQAWPGSREEFWKHRQERFSVVETLARIFPTQRELSKEVVSAVHQANMEDFPVNVQDSVLLEE